MACKWNIDRFFLPLETYDWGLYLDIHVIAAVRLRRLPNLLRPRGFNDQMKWLMLFAQHELMPRCVDKVAVREVVARAIGVDYLIPLRVVSESWDEVASRVSDGPGVMKCSHDSGSAWLFDDPTESEVRGHEEKFKALVAREYGVGKGEWMYRDVPRRILIEERLPGTSPGVGPADIKVHCVNGEPALIHVIEGRQGVQKQAFFSPTGQRLRLRVKPHRAQIEGFEIGAVLNLVLGPVRKLASPFRYVRVDMYVVENRAYFGELSFHEQSGLFKNRAEEIDLAKVLKIECVNPQKTIHRKVLSLSLGEQVGLSPQARPGTVGVFFPRQNNPES